LVGLSDYMFDSAKPMALRALSLFHVVLPPMLVWMVYRLGYDSQAVIAQTVLCWVVLLICYFFTRPSENVNWVWGTGRKPNLRLLNLPFVFYLMVGLPLLIYLPTHLLLKKYMPDSKTVQRAKSIGISSSNLIHR